MNVGECFRLGHITKAHGIKGEVKSVLDAVDHFWEEDLTEIYLLRGAELVRYEVEEIRHTGGSDYLLKLEKVNDRNAADLLARQPVYVPKDILPEPEEGGFHPHEVVGFTVSDDHHGTLGRIMRIVQMPAQDLVEMIYKGKEVLFPIAGEIVKGIDRESKTMFTRLPAGLLEVYIGGGDEEE